MNIFDNDFPEVTEAYRGSLEDWLELFERYAFPIAGNTETSAEMKRIFKRYPEATYEDWLDIVIKCARDEIWYEEKINLSIRELYLVVNKVARLSEKLRNAYNINTNKIPLTETNSTYKITSDALSAFKDSFEDICKRAADDSAKTVDSFTDKDLFYWRTLKRILSTKAGRQNQTTTENWINRFISFYKSYCAEQAISSYLNEQTSTIELTPVDQNNTIHFDIKNEADFKAIITKPNGTKLTNILVEVKTIDSNTSIHKAQLVIRHAEIYENTKSLKIFIVGRKHDLLNFFGVAQTDDGELTIETLENSGNKNKKFSMIKTRQSLGQLGKALYGIPQSGELKNGFKVKPSSISWLYTPLYDKQVEISKIQGYLLDIENKLQNKATNDQKIAILDMQAQAMTTKANSVVKKVNKSIGQDNKEVTNNTSAEDKITELDPIKYSDNLEDAEQNLKNVTDNFISKIKTALSNNN